MKFDEVIIVLAALFTTARCLQDGETTPPASRHPVAYPTPPVQPPTPALTPTNPTQQTIYHQQLNPIQILTYLAEKVQRIQIEINSLQKNSTISELKQSITQLQNQLNQQAQAALINDLDLGNIPENKEEDVVKLVTAFAAWLGVEMDEKDIVYAERVGGMKARGSRRIAVRFARRAARDKLLIAARAAADELRQKPLAPTVSERLTPFFRSLLRRARDEVRRRNWHYVGTRRGRVYVRQSVSTSPQWITSEADLDRVFGPRAEETNAL